MVGAVFYTNPATVAERWVHQLSLSIFDDEKGLFVRALVDEWESVLGTDNDADVAANTPVLIDQNLERHHPNLIRTLLRGYCIGEATS